MISKPEQRKTDTKSSAQDSKAADRAPETTTIVIKHPVSATAEFLFGTMSNFSNRGEIPNSLLYQRAILTLRTRGVQVFGDGHYHGEIHPLGMYDLLSSGSRVDLERHGGLLRLETKPGQSQLLLVHGIRWEVSPRFLAQRLYGSNSDPSNVLLIDLVAPGPGVSQ